MLPVVDANVILRYLFNDVPSQAKRAKQVIEEGCEVNAEVLAEVVYVLVGVYDVPRPQVAQTLISLLDIMYTPRSGEMIYALECYGDSTFDFVDCILLAQNQISGRTVISFDKKLQKELGA